MKYLDQTQRGRLEKLIDDYNNGRRTLKIYEYYIALDRPELSVYYPLLKESWERLRNVLLELIHYFAARLVGVSPIELPVIETCIEGKVYSGLVICDGPTYTRFTVWWDGEIVFSYP